MSIDLQWETLTGGVEGKERAEKIRSFIHDKFQLVPFPKFIKSVRVHSFSFGTIPPDIEIKSITDPYPEFYEQDEEDESSAADDDSGDDHDEEYLLKLERERRRRERKAEDPVFTRASSTSASQQPPPPYSEGTPRTMSGFRPGIADAFAGRVGVTGVATPLFNPIPTVGSASNLHYFHSALSYGNGGSPAPPRPVFPQHSTRVRHSADSSPSPSPPSPADPGPPLPVPELEGLSVKDSFEGDGNALPRQRLREPRDDDTQVIARVRYAGDVKIEITCELLFEYPITNFVALPVKLVITGCTFDGLACVAYIRRRAHFCFLDEDPEAVGGRGEGAGAGGCLRSSLEGRSLLKQINVESEIGEKGKGKQVLKNVGKVERFVLDQVRRIFEEEFVFPSSWTFLV